MPGPEAKEAEKQPVASTYKKHEGQSLLPWLHGSWLHFQGKTIRLLVSERSCRLPYRLTDAVLNRATDCKFIRTTTLACHDWFLQYEAARPNAKTALIPKPEDETRSPKSQMLNLKPYTSDIFFSGDRSSVAAACIGMSNVVIGGSKGV